MKLCASDLREYTRSFWRPRRLSSLALPVSHRTKQLSPANRRPLLLHVSIAQLCFLPHASARPGQAIAVYRDPHEPLSVSVSAEALPRYARCTPAATIRLLPVELRFGLNPSGISSAVPAPLVYAPSAGHAWQLTRASQLPTGTLTMKYSVSIAAWNGQLAHRPL